MLPSALWVTYTMPLVIGAEVFLDASDPEALAREHVRLGYRAAVCPDVSIDDTDRLAAIREAFARHGVLIAEVWAWRNIQTPDAAARKDNIAYVVHQLAVADAVGARCCVDVAGSFDGATLSGPHPRNLSREFFDATVDTCRAIIDAVKPTRSFLTLEMKGWNLPDGPDAYLQLLRAIDRKAFAVHMDVFNAINSPYRFYGSGDFIRECFRLLGPVRQVVSRQGSRLGTAGEERVFPRDGAGPRRDRLDRVSDRDRQGSARR